MKVTLKSRTYRYAVEIMRAIVEAGYTYEIHRKALQLIITVQRGGDPRTLQNWEDILIRLGFLRRIPGRPKIFRVEWQGIPELLNVAVKTGQKKLM